MMPGDWDKYDGPGGGRGGDNVIHLPLRASRARLPDPATIPPRPWLYGTHLMRGFVSLLVSPGGVGKTQLGMIVAASMARGKTLLGPYVHHRVNTWILNLEDPLDELERRLAGIMLHYRIPPEELAETLFMDSGRDRPLCMAQIDPDGTSIVYPDKDEIIAVARQCDIGLIVVDPFIKSHGLEENNNPHMNAAATAWAEVATAVGCAVLIIHHVRKGPVLDVDSARGGSALKDAARMALLLAAMTPEEAERMGVPDAERSRYVRLDDGKTNMAARADRAEWMMMQQVELGNGTPEYPHGDTVTALSPWKPPTVVGNASMSDVIDVLDAIAAGSGEGEMFSPSAAGRNNDRWAGHLMIDRLGLTKGQSIGLVKTWLNTGLLMTTEYLSPANRKSVAGVRVDPAKLAAMKSGAWTPPMEDAQS